MIKIARSKLWHPQYVVGTVADIDPHPLQAAGIECIVFDFDNTLVHHRVNAVPDVYMKHLQSLKKAGLQVLIGTNTRRDIRQSSVIVGAEVVRPAGLSYKPLPSFYRRVLAVTGTLPEHTAMVGDHVLNDIIGANQAGFTTILVRVLHKKTSWQYREYVRRVLKHSYNTNS